MKKTIYDTNVRPYLKLITELRSDGKDQQEVADYLNVNYNTFSSFLYRHDELAEAWIEGEYKLAERLEATALRVALGYKFQEKKTEEWFDKKGKLTGKKVTTFQKYQHPNPAILQEGLKVLNSKKWSGDKNKKEIEVVLEDEKLIEYSE